MSAEDVRFEQLLAAHNQEFMDAEPFGDWTPPAGLYNVIVSKVDKDIAKDKETSADFAWWRISGRILEDPQFANREFSLFFADSRNMRRVKTTVNSLYPDKTFTSLAEASKLLLDTIGLVLQVEVKTEHNKKSGRDFTNIYVKDILATSEAEVAP